MSQISVKFDPIIQHSEIIIPLTNSSHEESGKDYKENNIELQQTSVYGIQAPLIMINNIVVDAVDVIEFRLLSKGVKPQISMRVRDRANLVATLDTPGLDNELRVQILPKFDGVYKKINLTFFISKSDINNGEIYIKGEYKLSSFTSSNLKSLGELCTYDLFETISNETGLGFASNMEKNEKDKRYVYCDYKSYEDILSREIEKSGVDNQICDYWIDFWNNLVLVDVYERYNSIDKQDDLKLYVSGQNKEMEEGQHPTYMEVEAILSNHPSIKMTELGVSDYVLKNEPGIQYLNGTDKLYSIYETKKSEHMDHLIMDGDVHKDTNTNFEYLGEVYSDYNYFLQKVKREDFLKKIRSNEVIQVTLDTPLLGIMRGNKINFSWYINNDFNANKLKNLENNNIKSSTTSDIILDDISMGSDIDGKFRLDNSVSGQYLITELDLNFENNKWSYVLTLCRPSNTKPKINDVINE